MRTKGAFRKPHFSVREHMQGSASIMKQRMGFVPRKHDLKVRWVTERGGSKKVAADPVPAFLAKFGESIVSHLKQNGVVVTETAIVDWRPADNPAERQRILEITIATDPQVALKLWDEISQRLDQQICQSPPGVREQLLKGTCVSVNWVTGSRV